jgi:hypothetical protein
LFYIFSYPPPSTAEVKKSTAAPLLPFWTYKTCRFNFTSYLYLTLLIMVEGKLVKGKFLPVHAMQAYKGRRGLFILNLGARLW